MHLPSEVSAILGLVAPASVDSASASTGWVSIGEYQTLRGIVMCGAAAGDLDVKLEVAKDATGTDAKDADNGTMSTIAAANAANKVALLDARVGALSTEDGFTHARLTVTTGGVNIVSGVLEGCAARYNPVTQGAVVQSVHRAIVTN